MGFCVNLFVDVFIKFLADRQAIGISCHPSVRLSVTDILWLTSRAQRKIFYMNNQPWVLDSGMQNFSHLLQEKHFQIGG